MSACSSSTSTRFCSPTATLSSTAARTPCATSSHATASARAVLIITWNLFHGRSLPPSRGSLYQQFAEKLHVWERDVALLQEVPPWWPQTLARDLGAEQRTATTSRNSLLAVRRAIAERRPELAKSNGGGA